MITKIKFPNTSTPSSVSGMKINNKDVLYLKRNGVTYYTKHFKVTTNLIGVSLATYDTPEYKQPLSLSFVLDTGKTLLPSTVKVTMGGVGITDTAFDFNTMNVTLASVTGDVTIEAIGAAVDAEVEYLESDGVAYIDTGIVPNNTLSFKVSFYNNGPLDSGGYGNVFGARKNYAGNMYQATLFNGGEVRFGTFKNTVPMTTGTINNVEFDGGTTIVCNGNTYTAQKGSISLPSNGTIILFGIRDNGDPSQLQAGRIYYCSFGSVRDFIPVRKDGVGYMYDKVSGQLFGNAASSGSFTFGSDVTSNGTNSLNLNNGLLGQSSGDEPSNEPNEMENI